MPEDGESPHTWIEVTVLASPAQRTVFEATLRLQAAATVQAALDASGLAHCHPEIDWAGMSVGIWSTPATRDQTVREGDRIELYRPLTVDPKEARRIRFRAQGARSAGLFATRRAGRKQGY